MRYTFQLAIAVVMCGGCTMRSTNEVREMLPSPDKTQKLVVFCRDAGATTGVNTQLSILRTDERLPNDGGNALIVDRGEAKAAWKKGGGILVTLDRTCRVFKRETFVRGTTIEYQLR